MNLIQLNVFREIMETGSISQAARNLGRTQPAVSLALKSLEESLGVQLFERRGRRLSPAPEARYLHSEASGILNRLAQVSRAMQSLRSAEVGQLALAAMPGPATHLFPKFMSDVMARSPGVTVSLHTRSSTQIRELSRSQAIDFAFSDYDREMFKWVREFNQYDLYSKSDQPPNVEELKPYYMELINEYFPQEIAW